MSIKISIFAAQKQQTDESAGVKRSYAVTLLLIDALYLSL